MTIKQLYYALALPAVGLIALLYGARQAGMALGPVSPGFFWRTTLFTAAAITAVAGPILIRSLFAYSLRGQDRASSAAFKRFQHKLILVSGLTPYLALAALYLNLPKFHASAIVLMAMYSLYYYYPSVRRINFDKKIFRVGHK
jgi:hypothetical protein